MQVEQKPSAWPYVATLVGLLLFCLTVPCLWQRDAVPDDLSDILPRRIPQDVASGDSNGTVRPPLNLDATDNHYQPISLGNLGPVGPFASLSTAGQLNLWAPPTLEELVRASAGAAHMNAGAGYNQFGLAGWPSFSLPADPDSDQRSPQTGSFVVAAPDPLLLAALEGAGQAVARYSLADMLPRMVNVSLDMYRTWAQPSRNNGHMDRTAASHWVTMRRSALRLVGPNERRAPPIDGHEPTIADSFTTSQPGDLEREFATDCWCVPQVLLGQLERLTQHPATGAWANRTIWQLHALMKRDAFTADDVQAVLASLSESALEAARMADVTSEDRLRVELLRAHWGLARRLDRWTVMFDMHIAARAQHRVASRGSLSALFGAAPGAADRPSQPLDDSTLANALETYEQSRDPRLGRQLVQQQRALESSSDSLDRALADTVEQHYRNANVRVTLTAELLNRLIGPERSDVRPISDRIAGAQVHGRAHTRSESHVRLAPAVGHWKLDVEATGVVESNTLADGGPVRLRSRGETDFTARRSIVVDANGVTLQPTVVNASSHNRLVGVTTDYDWVPLFGSYTRQRALAQYRSQQHRAIVASETRVERHAGDQMDEQTLQAVNDIRAQIRERLTDRLSEFDIELTPVELTSTEERVVARLRVAGDHQLGSHTPRPRALSDSLASFQVHETALTNAAVSLALDGQRFTAPELQKLLREKLPNQVASIPPAARPDTVFQFVAEDAVQFRIENGRLELTIALASLEREGRTMRDVVVHAYYVPLISGLKAELVRDGSLGIEGRLSSTDRARMHNIFNAVLPPDRRLPIVPISDPADPRLEGLMITQLVLEDGWLGVAIGPAAGDRIAERSRSLR